jgi:hypothetical protein
MQRRTFLSSTPVQQTLLVFVANLGYDAASLACVHQMPPFLPSDSLQSFIFNQIVTSGVLFSVASALFVLGLVLDVRAVQEEVFALLGCSHLGLTRNLQLGKVDAAPAAIMRRRMWRRWLAFGLNTIGGVLTLLGSIWYILAGAGTLANVDQTLQFGDFLFALGTWLFCAGLGTFLEQLSVSASDADAQQL